MRLRFKSPWAHRVQSVLRRPSTRSVAEPAVAPAPVDAAWDEAFLRVESYLRAHHVESRVLLSRLTTEIIQTARELADQFPQEAPVTLAMRVTHAQIGDWLQRALGEGDWADERFRARGRLALLLSEFPQRSPELFLAADAVTDALRESLSHAQLQPAPEFRPVPMPPAPLEFPLAESAEEKWVTFSRSTFNRAAASWLLFVSALGFAWYATH